MYDGIDRFTGEMETFVRTVDSFLEDFEVYKGNAYDAFQMSYPETTESQTVMSLNYYQRKAMTTRMDSCSNFSYMSFGLVAEVGEIADKVAKANLDKLAARKASNTIVEHKYH